MQEELKDVAMRFIVHDGEDIKKTIQNKSYELRRFPAGSQIVKCLPNEWNIKTAQTGLVAVGRWSTRAWYMPIKKNRFLAVFVLDGRNFKDSDHVRWHAYHMIFHALDQIEGIKNGEIDQDRGAHIVSYTTEAQAAYQNMLADIFTVLMCSLNRQRSTIKMLGKLRAVQAFDVVPGGQPELYPYPLAVDATQIVFQDFQTYGMSKTSHVQNALEIAREIEHSFDEQSLQQWYDFAVAAQNMAWRGLDRHDILQAAMFYSEDPFMRSMAYLVAEFLNTEPRPGLDLQSYNPFTESDVNDRLHHKQCVALLDRIVRDFDIDQKQDTIEYVESRIQKQEKLSTSGRVTGWCVPALAAIIKALSDDEALHEYEDDIPAYLKKVFEDEMQAWPWEKVLSMGQETIDQRRMGEPVEAETFNR